MKLLRRVAIAPTSHSESTAQAQYAQDLIGWLMSFDRPNKADQSIFNLVSRRISCMGLTLALDAIEVLL